MSDCPETDFERLISDVEDEGPFSDTNVKRIQPKMSDEEKIHPKPPVRPKARTRRP